MQLSSKAKTQFGAAMLFILLGFGNIIFGHMKSTYYLELLKRDHRPAAFAEDPSNDMENAEMSLFLEEQSSVNVKSLMFPEVITDKRTQYLKRVTSRLEYYRIAILGGKVFLAIAGVFLLAMLITLSMDEKTEGV